MISPGSPTRPATAWWLLLITLLFLSACSERETLSRREQAKPAKPGKKYAAPTQRPYVIKGVRYYPIPSAKGYQEQGRASWYGKKFHGRKTANGETYDMYGSTAAHKTLPMGTMLLVKNLENKRKVVVRVNDRGPFAKNRIIDLTYTSAKELGMIKNGTASVEIIALGDQEQAPEPQEKTVVARQPVPGRAAEGVPDKDLDQGRFYVQAGAFVELSKARKLARTFADQGRNVVIQQYPAAGMNLYRVMIFAGTSLAKVKAYEQYLEANGYPDALVLAR
ncbi:septal ring lytic transglycosylase RlpA family protein [Desulfogranum mediterraneum]|uniref:septal ring lytic transglycosylase RlpA family protein n=1 Tax=Desulfogranum mediterraneum TaxID=160661 RepID=UPI0003F97D4B|nr:septal ring lytic transglycosylase RlpA family protein [Desulfogranum mediterraneum]